MVMTAEICVMNTMGIAMAADSAVTIGSGRKIYNSANKLFTLSKIHPVGTMVYGNANFVKIPWESIIKVYRNNLGNASFDRIMEYSDSFMDFLKASPFKEMTAPEQEDYYVLSTVNHYFERLVKDIIGTLKNRVNEFPEFTDEEILVHIANAKIEELLQKYEEMSFITNFGDKDIRYLLEKYGENISEMVGVLFEKMIFSEDLVTNLSYIGVNYLLKEFSPDKSGIVIAGFGETEIYPSLYSFYIDGLINGKIKMALHSQEEIGFNCDASIIPFAQSDMAHTFIRGIDPDFELFSNSYLTHIFDRLPVEILSQLKDFLPDEYKVINEISQKLVEELTKLNDNYNEIMNNYKQENFTSPILSVVRSLPKDELAEIAEALVNLTSFRRKVSSRPETVGGPIDVAVITKGDGMVWIKRKHYFDANINQQFNQKYFRREIK
jgi:hypothetical protein